MSKSYLIPHSFSRIDVATSIDRVVLAGNTFTATSTESGSFIILNSTSGSIVSVPNVGTGLDLTFIVGVTGGHTITCPTNTIFGSLNFPFAGTGGNLLANGKTSISTTTGSCVGDRLKLTCDGTNFYLAGTVSRFNALNIV